MSHVTTKVASTLLIGVAAAAVSTVLPSRAVNAADSCQTEPGADKGQGKHWYYHIERGTGRHCWYLRGEDDKSARADDDKEAASDKAPPGDVDAAAARSFADAHAEIASKTARPDNTNAAAAPSVWPAPSAAKAAPPVANAAPPVANTAPANDATAGNSAPAQPAPDSALASRWPQAADTAAPSPTSQPDATLMAADTQENTATATPTDTPPPPAAAVAAPPERQIGSIQKLAMVAVGALTLAGLTGSAVYRLGRRRRRNDWLRERNAWQDAQNPNRPPWVDEPRLHSNQVADLDDLHPSEPESDFSVAMSETEAGNDRVEKIEEYLARLTQQLHQELEGTRPHNAA
jgi:hypothetical protein